jgi:hypothetical protein
MSDYIQSLPTDEEPIPPDQKQIIDSILVDDKKSSIQYFMHELKLPLIVGIFTILIFNNKITDIIKDLVPYTRKSETSLLVFRTFIMMVLVFFYLNIGIVMK